MLGIVSPGKVLSGALYSLFVMLWKFTMISMVRVDTDKAKFKPPDIWSSALRRLDRKIEAYARHAKSKQIRAIGLGRAAPPLHAFNPVLAPLAELNEEYELVRNHTYSRALRDLTD